MTEISLELKDIKKSFVQEEEVLQGISLAIGQGEFITLLGASGCGKTTTLRRGSGDTGFGQRIPRWKGCHESGAKPAKREHSFSELRAFSPYECGRQCGLRSEAQKSPESGNQKESH